MMRLTKWDLLLIGLLVSPLTIEAAFIHSMYGLLTVEVVPANQGQVPIPSEWDIVEVYGTWVRDAGHYAGDFGWNEIHPAFYLRNLTTGAEGGTQQCKLLANVHDPERLAVIDAFEPCKWARGKVEFVFSFGDGDIHIDLLLEAQYQYLAKTGAPLLTLSYPTAVLLTGVSAAGFGLFYGAISLVHPRRTLVGRLILRLFGL